MNRSHPLHGLFEAGLEGVGLGVGLRREGLELLQATGVDVRVCFVQERELHGEVPPLFLVLHVRNGRLEAVDALAELDELEAEVDGVLPDLLDPVEDEAEGVLHEGERGVGHFVGSCERDQTRVNLGILGNFEGSNKKMKKNGKTKKMKEGERESDCVEAQAVCLLLLKINISSNQLDSRL